MRFDTHHVHWFTVGFSEKDLILNPAEGSEQNDTFRTFDFQLNGNDTLQLCQHNDAFATAHLFQCEAKDPRPKVSTKVSDGPILDPPQRNHLVCHSKSQ